MKFKTVEENIKNIGVSIYEDKEVINLIKQGKISESLLNSINLTRCKRDELIFDFLNLLTDAFDKEFDLKFNKKTEILRLENPKHRNTLLNSIKKVSGDAVDLDDYSEKSPIKKIDKICAVINKLNRLEPSGVLVNNNKNIIHGLKLSYDKHVNNLLDKRDELKEKVEKSFGNFNFTLTKVYPQAITLLLSKSKKLTKQFKKHVKAKEYYTTSDRDMIVTMLCNLNFTDKQLFKLLRKTDFIEIIRQFDEIPNFLSNKNTGYYTKINVKNVINIASEVSLTEQIRMRCFAEKEKDFSVALNHLLNELQLICCILDNEDIKKYNAHSVKAFLINRSLDTLQINNIMGLFDRRNNNPISHSGSDERFAKNVSRIEYNRYKNDVEYVLIKILK